MARNKMFDNINKIIKAAHTAVVAGSGTVSDEVDLELPRGYVAKIWLVEFINTTADGVITNVQAALINDPDDITTITIPENQVQHDVIADYYHQSNASNTVGSHRQQVYFPEHIDVIAARNLRFNLANSGTGGTNVICLVYYTLEEVTSDLLVELLDIL